MKKLILAMLFPAVFCLALAVATPGAVAAAEEPEEDMPDAALIMNGEGNGVHPEKDATNEKAGD